MKKERAIHEPVVNKAWAGNKSCLNKLLTIFEEVLNKSWTSDEQVMKKWFTSNEVVTAKSWANNGKPFAIHAQVINKT